MRPQAARCAAGSPLARQGPASSWVAARCKVVTEERRRERRAAAGWAALGSLRPPRRSPTGRERVASALWGGCPPTCLGCQSPRPHGKEAGLQRRRATAQQRGHRSEELESACERLRARAVKSTARCRRCRPLLTASCREPASYPALPVAMAPLLVILSVECCTVKRQKKQGWRHQLSVHRDGQALAEARSTCETGQSRKWMAASAQQATLVNKSVQMRERSLGCT